MSEVIFRRLWKCRTSGACWQTCALRWCVEEMEYISILPTNVKVITQHAKSLCGRGMTTDIYNAPLSPSPDRDNGETTSPRAISPIRTLHGSAIFVLLIHQVGCGVVGGAYAKAYKHHGFKWVRGHDSSARLPNDSRILTVVIGIRSQRIRVLLSVARKIENIYRTRKENNPSTRIRIVLLIGFF